MACALGQCGSNINREGGAESNPHACQAASADYAVRAGDDTHFSLQLLRSTNQRARLAKTNRNRNELAPSANNGLSVRDPLIIFVGGIVAGADRAPSAAEKCPARGLKYDKSPMRLSRIRALLAAKKSFLFYDALTISRMEWRAITRRWSSHDKAHDVVNQSDRRFVLPCGFIRDPLAGRLSFHIACPRWLRFHAHNCGSAFCIARVRDREPKSGSFIAFSCAHQKSGTRYEAKVAKRRIELVVLRCNGIAGAVRFTFARLSKPLSSRSAASRVKS